MMAHRVRILPSKTFRLNLAVTTPYNADFDGDEMNMHVPQTIQAQVEAREMLSVTKNLVSSGNNCTMIGLVQDSLLGIHRLTNGSTFFDYSDTMQLLSACHYDTFPCIPQAAILKPQCMWTGRQVVSTLIVKGTNIDGVISDGDVLTTLTKKHVGKSGGKYSLLHQLARRGNLPRFIERAQKLAHAFLLLTGFSTGIGDCIVKSDVIEQVDNIKKSVNAANSTNCRDRAGSIVVSSGLRRNNSFLSMCNAGSKGSKVNVCQVMGLLGQQIVSGGKIAKGMLPHFKKDDESPSCTGFISSNYVTGLKPHEFWFHSMSGREGIIDTAVKTAESGYIERKLVKATEDLVLKYDNTTRNVHNDVIQFTYGGDGFDATQLIRLPMIFCSQNKWSEMQWNKLCDEDGAFDAVSRLQQFISQHKIEEDDIICTPFNLEMIIEQSKNAMALNVIAVPTCSEIVRFIFSLPTHKLQLYVAYGLSVHRVRNILHLDQLQWDFIVGEINRLINKARVQPGEPVGILAATNIAEPATQLTLNSFHHTGIASARVHLNSGVPRLLELINCSVKTKTPSCTFKYSGNEDPKRSFVECKLLSFTCKFETIHPEDLMWLKHYEQLFGRIEIGSRWMFRCKLSSKLPFRWQQSIHLHKAIENIAATNWPAPCALLFFKPNVNLNFAKKITKTLFIGGAHNIKDLVFCKETSTVHTKGTNICAMWSLIPHYNEALNTYTNHPHDALKALGIEAARAVLLYEIKKIIDGNSFIDSRHLELLVDIMCHEGTLNPVNRHGVASRQKTLSKSSFECSTNTFVKASIAGLKDDVKGVSSSIMMGKLAPIGTALPADLLLKHDVLQHAQPYKLTKQKISMALQEISKKLPSGDMISPFSSPDDDILTISPFSDPHNYMPDTSTLNCEPQQEKQVEENYSDSSDDEATFSPIKNKCNEKRITDIISVSQPLKKRKLNFHNTNNGHFNKNILSISNKNNLYKSLQIPKNSTKTYIFTVKE